MNKKKFKQPDYYLMVIVFLLIVVGFLVSSRVFAEISEQRFGNPTHYFFHQLLYGFLLGLVLGVAAYKVSLSSLKKWSLFLILFNLILMVLVFVPGLKVFSGGAARWINFGWFTFQPSEFLKLSFIVYLAALMSSRSSDKRAKKDWKLNLAPFLTVLGFVVALLYFQSDLSTLVVISISALAIYFLSGTPLWQNVLLFLTAFLVFFIFVFSSSYRMKRIFVLLGISRDPLGIGYQVKQTLISIGSGGILGQGLREFSQMSFIPHLISDSVFAEIGRMLGFLGSALLVALYCLFLWRGVNIAKNSKDNFSKLLVIGIISWIYSQAIINIGAMLKILPLTGIPLPFISYGGSHIAIELAAVGLLLNVSSKAK
ncbi:MAG TPA: cell division protein FtsW [Candidatus Parcubacteria bacterium]|nr:cell division protein FtsW [Candidatus Parcubacteria bacterium]